MHINKKQTLTKRIVFLLFILLSAPLPAQLIIQRAKQTFYKYPLIKKRNIPTPFIQTARQSSVIDGQCYNSYRRAHNGQLLEKGTSIRVMHNGQLSIKNKQGETYLIAGESHLTIAHNHKIILHAGTMYRFPQDSMINLNLIQLEWTPTFPESGTTCTITLRSKDKIWQTKLKLKKKWRSYFYYIGKEKQYFRYQARFGLDCQDRRKEQPFTISAKSNKGIVFVKKFSILLSSARHMPRDFENRFKRVRSAPLKSPRLKNKKSYTSKFFFKKIAKLIKHNRCIHKKRKIRKPRFPALRYRPNVSLPAAKRALYRKRREIQRESRIHSKALAYSNKRKLWKGNFIYPAADRFSSIFGSTRTYTGGWASAHRGLDIAAWRNTPVKAPNNGIVRFAGKTVLCGNNIIIDHGQYLFSKIFHMKKLVVRTGQYVRKGQIIGYTGSTGISTGPHIHWEVWVGNTKVDPNQWVHRNSTAEATGHRISAATRRLAELLFIAF